MVVMSIMAARDHTLSYKKSKSWLWYYSSYSCRIGMTFNKAAATVLLIMLITLCTGAVTATEELECPKALFSFGASAADTGNVEAAFPFTFVPQTTLPYGETFFHHPANRYSNGRLIIDFYAQALKFPFLSPYLQSVGSDFRHGVNFASSGATAENITVLIPFYLQIQIQQFRYFKQRVLGEWNISRQGAVNKLLIKPSYFTKGLYMIQIGVDDFTVQVLLSGHSLEQIQANLTRDVPAALLAGVEGLIEQGANTIMVHNIPPLGCYPLFIATLKLLNMTGPIDSDGCITDVNLVIQATNAQFVADLEILRTKIPTNISIIVADLYSIVNTIIRNGSQFGFTETTRACCGIGEGPTNVDPLIPCGASGLVNGKLIIANNVCANPNEYVSWDGVHITEAVNRIVVEKFLAGRYLQPFYNLSSVCNLSFAQF